MRNKIAGQQSPAKWVGMAAGFSHGLLDFGCQIIPRVFRCWTVSWAYNRGQGTRSDSLWYLSNNWVVSAPSFNCFGPFVLIVWWRTFVSKEQDLHSDKSTKWRWRGTNGFLCYSPKQVVCIGIPHYLPVFRYFFSLRTNISGTWLKHRVVLWRKSHLSDLSHLKTKKLSVCGEICCLVFSDFSFRFGDIQVF